MPDQASPNSFTLSHLPKPQVQHFKARELRYPLQSPFGDFGTAVQIDASKLGKVVSDELKPLVCDANTLSNVQRLQLVHLPHHPVDSIVADVT